MRRGDCCLLKWSDVDLQNRVITVKTSKTGRTAVIPLFPLLEEEIRRHLPAKNDFVFPEPAKRYTGNPDHITDLADRVCPEDTCGSPGTHKSNGGLEAQPAPLHVPHAEKSVNSSILESCQQLTDFKNLLQASRFVGPFVGPRSKMSPGVRLCSRAPHHAVF